MSPDYIAPEVAVPLIVLLWGWLALDALARRARLRRQTARRELRRREREECRP